MISILSSVFTVRQLLRTLLLNYLSTEYQFFNHLHVDPALSSSQYQRMVGGKSLQSGSSAVKKMVMENSRKVGGAMSAGGHTDKLSKYYQE